MAAGVSLKKKLVLTFSSMLIVAMALIAIAVVNLQRMREATGWNDHTYKVMSASQEMLLNMVNIETGTRGFVASGDEKYLEPFRTGKTQFDASIDKTKSLTSDNQTQQARLEKLLQYHQQFLSVANNLIRIRQDVTAGKTPIDDLLKEFNLGKDKAAMDAFRTGIAEVVNTESSLLDERSATLASTASSTNNILVFGGLLLCAVTVFLGTWLTRSIFRQLGAEPSVAAALVTATAQGDLSIPIILRNGDTSSLLAQLSVMQLSLSQTVSAVRENADGVATASAQIAQGNQDLSGRTEQQASALEETAASMEELSSTVKQNADNARQASQLAVNASSVASEGGAVVQQFVQTMNGINDSSKKMAEIIGVIDGIAFQTNILALNAAVEAARAGEQGRGFAVVASEVRSLAQRSAGAAKEIKGLIDASMSQVRQGTELVAKAGHTMSEVVTAIRQVTDIIGEVSAASSEQSLGVSQVGEAVTQMDQVTQQNAALVEESAAAASSLSAQASKLQQSVATFRLKNESLVMNRRALALPA